MKTIVIVIMLFGFGKIFANDNYIQSVHQQLTNAVTNTQKINAYQNWLPLAILIHHPDAKKDLENLNQLVENNNDTLGKGIYNLNKAYYIVENYGDYNIGLELCLKAKDIFEYLNAKPQLVTTYNRLAFLVLWNQIGKKDVFIKENLNDKYLIKALKIAKEINSKDLQIETLGFIGSYYIVTEDNIAKALSYFFEAEKLLDEKTPPDINAVVLESIAIVYADAFKEREMMTYAKKCESLPFFKTFGYGQSNMYRAIAKMYLLNPINKNLTKALFYANKSYNISLQMNAPEYISQGEQRLYEIYKANGDEKKALYYLEKYRLHEDSLSRERFQRTYADYDIVKKEGIIKSLENDKLKQKNENDKTIRSGLLLALLGGIGFGGYVIFSNKKLKQKNEALILKNEEIEKALQRGRVIERKSVAADLHDGLGVQANAIMYNAELLRNELPQTNQRIDLLYDAAKEMLLTLRETLWAMKNYEIQAWDIWLRIVNLCHQMSRHYKNIQIIAEGKPPQTNIYEAPKALNIVMIVHEALNNAIKHADASKIIVQTHYNNMNWSIKIIDDGKGFDEFATAENPELHGLENMQERAFASKIDFKINTLTTKGSSIILTIKI